MKIASFYVVSSEARGFGMICNYFDLSLKLGGCEME